MALYSLTVLMCGYEIIHSPPPAPFPSLPSSWRVLGGAEEAQRYRSDATGFLVLFQLKIVLHALRHNNNNNNNKRSSIKVT